MFNRTLKFREILFLRFLGISNVLDYIANLGVLIVSSIFFGLLGVYTSIHILDDVIRFIVFLILIKYLILLLTIVSQEIFSSRYVRAFRNEQGKGKGDYLTFRNGNKILRRLKRN